MATLGWILTCVFIVALVSTILFLHRTWDVMGTLTVEINFLLKECDELEKRVDALGNAVKLVAVDLAKLEEDTDGKAS